MLDLVTGNVMKDTKIDVPANNIPNFTASAQHSRPGLLLTASGLYIAFGANFEGKG
jgi:hypothetical protein